MTYCYFNLHLDNTKNAAHGSDSPASAERVRFCGTVLSYSF